MKWSSSLSLSKVPTSYLSSTLLNASSPVTLLLSSAYLSYSSLKKCQMERLRNLGIDPNVPRSEIIPLLSSQPTDSLLRLRECFFEELRLKGLVHVGDELVSRRCTSRGKPLPVKLSEDVCSLVHCLKNDLPAPRCIIKNGKRDRAYLESSRANTSQSIQSSQSSTQLDSTHSECADNVALSSIMRELNSMKESFRVLRSEVMSMNNNTRATKAPSTCHVYVSCKNPCSAPDLPLLLGCPVLYANRVGSRFSWKVKIHRHSLYDALRSTADTHSVRVWCNNGSKSSASPSPSSDSPICTTDHGTVTIASWNCRGLHNSKPYILDLIQNGADIIVLQEHWLWPYDLSSLSSIHPQYDFTAVSDKRLHSGSDLERGCGGVALIWKKALPCIPFQLLTATEFVGFAFSYQVQRATLSAASQSWGSICLVLINLKICLSGNCRARSISVY